MMHDDTAAPDAATEKVPAMTEAPRRLEVRYHPASQAMRTGAILLVAGLCALIPFTAEDSGEEAWHFAGLLAGLALLWAIFAAMRIRDRRPQVVVDRDGIFVRHWMLDTVPWDNIDYIAHSSSVRRSMVASLTRSRRRPYLLFHFVERPKIVTTAPPPLSWLQFLRAESELQEPVIQQRGLDTPVERILEAIQEHIAFWRQSRDSTHSTSDTGIS